MANKKHLDILKQGIDIWNEWREKNRDVKPDLSRAVLRKMRLNRANLRDVDLSRSDLWASDLRNAKLVNATLNDIDLSDCNLASANLENANLNCAYCIKSNFFNAKLNNAILTKAILNHADFNEAKLKNADLRNASLFMTQFDRADLTNANLSNSMMMGAILIGTNLERANISNCKVYGISVWNIKLTDAIQKNLVISPEGAPVITVDNLEVAQFIYLLLNNKRIRHVIETITTKVVLILGRFTPERRAVLNAIREELRKLDYIPVLFDFEKPASKDIHETVTTLARLAKFIIADITSSKSIPQELTSIVPDNPSLPVMPIIKKGSKPWGMFDHIRKYPWVLDIYEYENLEELISSLKKKVISPAEAKVKEVRENNK